jgi:hypothetical protein
MRSGEGDGWGSPTVRPVFFLAIIPDVRENKKIKNKKNLAIRTSVVIMNHIFCKALDLKIHSSFELVFRYLLCCCLEKLMT